MNLRLSLTATMSLSLAAFCANYPADVVIRDDQPLSSVSVLFFNSHRLPATVHRCPDGTYEQHCRTPVVVSSPSGLYVSCLPLVVRASQSTDVVLGEDWKTMIGAEIVDGVLTEPCRAIEESHWAWFPRTFRPGAW